MIIVALIVGVGAIASCSCDDDDDDDDDNDDVEGDDDNDDDDDDDDDDTGDDDDDDDDSCDGYDLTMDGETESPQGALAWTAYLNIDVATGDMEGMIDPEDEEIDPYVVTGFRHDATTGWLEGSFPTPSSITPDICEAETVSNHIDFAVVSDAMAGTVIYYCGEIDEANYLFTRNTLGQVTCGDFAM